MMKIHLQGAGDGQKGVNQRVAASGYHEERVNAERPSASYSMTVFLYCLLTLVASIYDKANTWENNDRGALTPTVPKNLDRRRTRATSHCIPVP
jgi:hypothetical protein